MTIVFLIFRISQIELKQQIESLTEELLKISEALQCPMELDAYVKKLVNAKHKVTIVSNILQTTQERLNKIHQAVERETSRKKSLLDRSSMYGSTTINKENGEESIASAAASETAQ